MQEQDYVQINRDPFAREDLIRRVVHTEKGCAWCGSNYHHHLFQYGIWPDAGYMNWQSELFCSVNCMRIYHS